MTMITPRHLSRNLEGDSTEVLIQTFADRILVLVTQLGKVGNLIQATIPTTTPLLPAPAPDPSHPNQLPLPPPSPAIQLTSLFGSAPSEHMQTLHSLYAAQISTIVWTEESRDALERKSVIVGLALRSLERDNEGLSEREKSVFQGVMSMVHVLLNQQ